jgi:hypothetical protein
MIEHISNDSKASGSHTGNRPARSYSVVRAASNFSNITGLVAGFALAAVVLVFTVGATAPNAPRVILGFAASLFLLAYVGSLILSYAFGALAGRRNTAAAMTHAMLLGSGLSVSFVAILGGFVALSVAFLPNSSTLFFLIAAAVVWAVQPAIWFPHREMIHEFGLPPYGSRAPTSDARAHKLVSHTSRIALVASVTSIVFREFHIVKTLVGPPREWEYVTIASAGILYTAFIQSLVLPLAMAASGEHEHREGISTKLLARVTDDGRLTTTATLLIATLQCATLFVILALLP